MAVVNVGVMGGTFDPIHNGHLAVAREVSRRLGMERVVFVPAGQPWLKSARAVTPAALRFEMVRLAIRRYRHFEVSRIEIDRAGPTYTIDTIRQMQAEHGPGHEFYFITGWDSLKQLPLWRDADLLVQLCRLVAVPRPGVTAPDISRLEAAIPGISERLMLLDRPQIEISSTEIRERLARGQPIASMVPVAVERYIREHGLYRAG